MKEPIPASRFAAAHAIAQELRVDPEHPGTLRLASALGATPSAEPTNAESGTRVPDGETPAPVVLTLARYGPDEAPEAPVSSLGR